MEEEFGDTFKSFGQQQASLSQSTTVSSRPKSSTKVAKTKEGFSTSHNSLSHELFVVSRALEF